MKVDIGSLRTRLTFQVEERTLNTNGGYDNKWVDAFGMWGRIEPQPGRPFRITDYFEAQGTDRIFVRYNEKIKQEMRVYSKIGYYHIITVKVHTDGNARMMELVVNTINDKL